MKWEIIVNRYVYKLLWKLFLVVLIVLLISSMFSHKNGRTSTITKLADGRQDDAEMYKMYQDLDIHCIRTVEDYLNSNGHFIIPKDSVLGNLPFNVKDCLYQRYTNTLQTICSNRSRHGTLANGWDICQDECYKPTQYSYVYAISTKNDDMNVLGVYESYSVKVRRFRPSITKEGIPKYVDKDITTEAVTLDKIIDTVRRDYNKYPMVKNILIVDVGKLTKVILEQLIHSGILYYMTQLSVRTNYRLSAQMIYYLPALRHLRQMYDAGFRIYWSRLELHGIMASNEPRSSSFFINMVYKNCSRQGSIDKEIKSNHLIIPNDNALSKLQQKDVQELYIRYITNVQFHCKEILRIGHLRDGGWNICHDKRYRPRHPCLLYSFGSCWDFSFEDDMVSTYGCKIHVFDPSLNEQSFRRSPHIWFHDVGLSNHTGVGMRNWNMSTINDIYTTLNHSSKDVNIIKMDIENSEWTALPDMIQFGAFKCVRQFLIELHEFSLTAKLEHLKILRDLYDLGFRIFYYHRNPIGKQSSIKHIQYKVADELYFVNINSPC